MTDDEHFPWHYTEFGVICACGSAMTTGEVCPADTGPACGMCTACGAVEVALNAATGFRDVSAIGEHERYPTGYGCEMCS